MDGDDVAVLAGDVLLESLELLELLDESLDDDDDELDESELAPSLDDVEELAAVRDDEPRLSVL